MSRTSRAAIALMALMLVAGVLIYSMRRSDAKLVGVVRATEVRVSRR